MDYESALSISFLPSPWFSFVKMGGEIFFGRGRGGGHGGKGWATQKRGGQGEFRAKTFLIWGDFDLVGAVCDFELLHLNCCK